MVNPPDPHGVCKAATQTDTLVEEEVPSTLRHCKHAVVDSTHSVFGFHNP